jgi:general secretion pathway protein H
MGAGFSSAPCIRHRSAGFTLLEMLLTVFLIGLMIGLVAIKIDRNADDIAKLEARRFVALVDHLRDEATFTGLPMGIEVSRTDGRYRFWELRDKWTQIDKVEVLRERVVPDPIIIELRLLQEKKGSEHDQSAQQTQEGEAKQEPNATPKNLVLVEPNGIIRPFIASFKGDQHRFVISLDNEMNPVMSDEKI